MIAAAVARYFYGTASDQTQLIVTGLCVQFCAFGMWSAIYVCTPELYPTQIRAAGTGLASVIDVSGKADRPSLISFILPTAGQSGVFALGAEAR
jgi:putative MFS transporter